MLIVRRKFAAYKETMPAAIPTCSSSRGETVNSILRFWWLGFLTGLAIVLIHASLTRAVDLKITSAFQELQILRQALLLYRQKTGEWPSPAQGLGVLSRPLAGERSLLASIPRDPWGSEYRYVGAGNGPGEPLVYSTGANGLDERGAGDDVTTPAKHYACSTYGIDCPMSWTRRGLWFAAAFAFLCLLVGLVRATARTFRKLHH